MKFSAKWPIIRSLWPFKMKLNDGFLSIRRQSCTAPHQEQASKSNNNKCKINEGETIGKADFNLSYKCRVCLCLCVCVCVLRLKGGSEKKTKRANVEANDVAGGRN